MPTYKYREYMDVPTASLIITPATSTQEINVKNTLNAEVQPVALNAIATNMLAGTTATITSNNMTIATVTGRIATWECDLKPATDLDYLCFTANTAGSTVLCPKPFEYSIDKEDWSTASTSSAITLTNIGDKIYLRNGNVGTVSGSLGTFTLTGSIAASGNIMSLIDNTCTSLTAPSECFGSMFNGCSVLTTAPDLPATTLEMGCYGSMFKNCTSLSAPPALPATTLAAYCYSGMFEGCTSLIKVPLCPALYYPAYSCYGMFYKCSSLYINDGQTSVYKYATRIPATGTGSVEDGSALYYMFAETANPAFESGAVNYTCYVEYPPVS